MTARPAARDRMAAFPVLAAPRCHPAFSERQSGADGWCTR